MNTFEIVGFAIMLIIGTVALLHITGLIKFDVKCKIGRKD